MKIGDKVRISKDGEATKEFGLTWIKHDCLGKVGVVSDITKAMITVGVENGCIKHEVEHWHPDDLTPLDPPSMALVQVGDIIKHTNGSLYLVIWTQNHWPEYKIGCIFKEPESLGNGWITCVIADITAIYKGGNLDNIINQSAEGLELIWERELQKQDIIYDEAILKRLDKIEAKINEIAERKGGVGVVCGKDK